MWKRWHPTTHIWERSVDNGLNWNPLPLNASTINEGSFAAARLPANVAYKNVNNNFSTTQYIPGTSRISEFNSILEFFHSGSGVGQKLYRIINYGVGDLRFESLNDAASAVTGTLWLANTGNFAVAGSVSAGGIGGFYELGWPNAIGYWIPVAFSAANFAGDGTLTLPGLTAAMVSLNTYMVAGKTLYWILNIGGFTTAGSGSILLKLPGGYLASQNGTIGTCILNSASISWGHGVINSGVGGAQISAIHLPSFAWPAGASNYLWMALAVPIQ